MSNLNYKIETAKTGYPVPVINDVHLHSLYDPLKEATEFAKLHEPELVKNNAILILGLGFAYHIKAIQEIMTSYHGENYKLVIIEPSAQIIDECHKLHLLPNTHVTIFNADNPVDLYHNKELVQFLLQRPHLLFHPASYNVYTDYFKTYLSYRPDNRLLGLTLLIQSEELKNDLKQYSTDLEIKEIVDIIHQKPLKNEYDFFLMAYDQIK